VVGDDPVAQVEPAQAIVTRHLNRYLDLFTGIATAAGVADPDLVGRQWLMLVSFVAL
jgi:hypothetical protein